MNGTKRRTRPAPAWRPAAVVTAALAMVATTGCSEGWDPYGRLSSLRVLAIRTDPPAPAAGDTVTITPLLYVPPGETVLSYQWSWCPYVGSSQDGYPCLVDEAQLAELGDDVAASIPDFDLGTGATATFTNSIPPGLLSTVCAGVPEAPQVLDCAEGYPAQIRLVVTTDSGAQVTAVRQLRLRYLPGQLPNDNPAVADISADLDGAEQTLDDMGSITVPRDVDTRLVAFVPHASSEPYVGPNADGEPEDQLERLTLSWFVESGSTRDERTGFIEGSTTFETLVENEWEPGEEKDYTRTTSKVIVVLRDNRDGVDWAEATVTLRDAP